MQQQVLHISILGTRILSNLHDGADFNISFSTLATVMMKFEMIIKLYELWTALFKTISLKFMAFYTLYLHYDVILLSIVGSLWASDKSSNFFIKHFIFIMLLHVF